MPSAEESFTRAGRIEPLIRLATGGMAEIWLARELGAAGLERFVVVKRLLPHLATDPSIVDMFVSEARFVARLVHPNVVQIHDLGEDDQGYFLVMEYVAGCSVRELAVAAERAFRKLPTSVAICIVEQACRGAHAAHELSDSAGNTLGLVHRDISPHNLMIGPSGDVKLLDFGIAKATALADATRTGSLKGKCTYMSPEQCQAKSIDRRSDIFSLGIVLWELLVGERLFHRDSEFASMEAIVSGDVPMPSEERAEIPVALDAVVAKALAKRPEDRWQTADALRRALVRAADKHDMRPSRDALAAELEDLLGDKLDNRQNALRDTALLASGSEADHAALQEALLGSNPRAHHSVSKVTGKTRSHADDAPTVVQRKSSRPPPTEDDGDEDTLAQTRHDRGMSSMPPASEPPPSAPPASETPASVAPPSTLRSDVPPRPKSFVIALVAFILAAIGFFTVVAYRLIIADDPGEEADGEESEAPALTGPALRFAIAPTVKPEVIEKELAPFVGWLQSELHQPVALEVCESYDACGDKVIEGKVDIGLLPPLLFVQTTTREPAVQPVALRLYDGSRSSDGYLLTRDDTPLLEGAADLRGRKVCLVDEESTTGYLLPRIWMREAGIDPEKDITVRLSGDHLAGMRDLAAKKCDAVAVYSGAYLSAREQGIPVGTMRVLAVTGRVPQDVITAAPQLPAGTIEKLRKVFLGFDPQRDVDASSVGEVLGISGFAEYDASEFDLIRRAAASEGLIPTTAPPETDAADAGTP